MSDASLTPRSIPNRLHGPAARLLASWELLLLGLAPWQSSSLTRWPAPIS